MRLTLNAVQQSSYTFWREDFPLCRYNDSTRKSGVGGKSAPSLSTIEGIWSRLISLLELRHRDIKTHYGPHEEERIKVHLDQLVKRGLLIKGLWFKKVWLGFVMIHT
jgi:hypothetical protein